MGFELTTLVGIVTDCIDSCKSNFQSITTTTAPPCLHSYYISTISKAIWITRNQNLYVLLQKFLYSHKHVLVDQYRISYSQPIVYFDSHLKFEGFQTPTDVRGLTGQFFEAVHVFLSVMSGIHDLDDNLLKMAINTNNTEGAVVVVIVS